MSSVHAHHGGVLPRRLEPTGSTAASIARFAARSTELVAAAGLVVLGITVVLAATGGSAMPWAVALGAVVLAVVLLDQWRVYAAASAADRG